MLGNTPFSVLRRQLSPHRVIAAVYVYELARSHVQVVRQERAGGAADGRLVLQSPAQRRLLFPNLFEILEPRNAARGKRRQRSRADGVDTNLVAPHVAREVWPHRL